MVMDCVDVFEKNKKCIYGAISSKTQSNDDDTEISKPTKQLITFEYYCDDLKIEIYWYE